VRYLLDTHAFLWFITDDPRLGAKARQIISTGTNEILLSDVTPWEIAIKVGLGRLLLGGPFATYIPREITRNAFQRMPISLDHTALLTTMPHHHRDPFDRMLIAQATVDRLPILSADTAFDAYGVTRLW
jgi:PIN domain nuclease of toxin-antitoxin system